MAAQNSGNPSDPSADGGAMFTPVPGWVVGALGERPYRFFRRTGSTNDEARRWAQTGAPAGAVVLAEEQTQGRGRQGRSWIAAPGTSLLMSMILHPDVPSGLLPRVNLMGAVALADVLAVWGLSPGVKWPNDVLLNGRKVAGILAEGVWFGEELGCVVLGIGVNVLKGALTEAAADAFHATTVETAWGQPPERGTLLRQLLERIEYWQARLTAGALLDAWRGYTVTLGRRVTATSGEESLEGVAENIDEQGALLVRLDDGRLRRLLAGDVTLQGSG